MMPIDPVLAQGLALAMSAILLSGALHKLRDLALFRAALENYRLVPPALEGSATMLLPACEALAGIALLFDAHRTAGAALGALLLVVVTAAVAVNLLRGRRNIDCGCGAGDSGQSLSWALVLRNAILGAALWGASLDTAARQLGWTDFLSIAGAAGALFTLYFAANQLLTNHTSLTRLRS
jgi:uncharacterized membrane protein